MRPRLRLPLAALVVTSLVWAGSASAGSGLQPTPGATTDASPSFVVALDPSDSNPVTHVGTSASVDASGASPDEIGSCVPTITLTGVTYSCRPSVYLTTGTAALPSGSYYWWLTYTAPDAAGTPTTHVSGPFPFTVASAPPPPAGVSLQGPADHAKLDTETPSLAFRAPAGLHVDVYVSERSERLASGAPAGTTLHRCSIATTRAGRYHCNIAATEHLAPGRTYYWWLTVRSGTSAWVFGPRSFLVRAAHDEHFAPHLPSSAHYAGKSVKQTRLSHAAYALSKVIGAPKSIAVACWSTLDWHSIAGDNPESGYTILGFWEPAMPHWLELSPGICNTLETVTYKRPRFANRFTANAVDTLTHEMIHALGIHDEAMTECFSMQLLWLTARSLGVPLAYAENLSRLSLENYGLHPPEYVNRAACREDGAWDLYKGRPSLPWHVFQL